MGVKKDGAEGGIWYYKGGSSRRIGYIAQLGSAWVFYSPKIIRVMKSRNMREEMTVVCQEQK